MDVLYRVTRNGEPIGYTINEDGLQYEVLDRGLYTSTILPELVNSGYKVLDYNCNIINPSNINIQDLTRKESEATEDDYQLMLDEAERALTEPECVKYFTHDTRAEEYKFIEPKSPEIKTREELIAYLTRCNKEYANAGIIYDVRPLNSFVAKEALFDIVELQNDPEVRNMFKIIYMRRRIGRYKMYRDLIGYLNDQGVLNGNMNPTPIEFLQAYTAWGVDGIKTPCYKVETKLNVDGEMDAVNEAATMQTVHANRMLEYGVMDRNGIMRYMDEEVDGYDIVQFGREVIAPASVENYNTNIATSRSWKEDYKVIDCMVIPQRDRMYFDFLDDNGFPFKVRIQHDRICFLNRYKCFYDAPFVIIRTVSGKYVTLDRASSEKDYYIMNMCLSKAHDMIEAVTKKVPVKSTYDMCRKEGLNPEAAIRWIARRIKENRYNCVSTSEYNGMDFWNASKLYRTGPSQSLIEKYNPREEVYDNVDELIDIMLDTQAAMIDDGTYAQSLNLDSKANSLASMHERDDAEMELRLKPLEQLSFVKACFNDEVSIEFLGDGIEADMGDDVLKLAKLILTTCKMVLGKDASVSDITSFINTFEDVKPFDLKNVVRPRDNAYLGYIKDRAVLNGRRGAESCYIFWVTKVFREMANVPIEQQRHYAMEVFALDVRERENPKNRNTQIAIANAVVAASQIAPITREQKWIVEQQAMDIASKVFIGIIFDTVKVSYVGGEHRVTVPVGEGVELNVLIPENCYNYIKTTDWRYSFKYITLCDYCTNEVSSNTKFGFYCLNADINPWYVVPKDGQKIPEYNFFVNYCQPEWFASFSDEFKSNLQRSGGKIATLHTNRFSNNVVEYSDLDKEEENVKHDDSTIDIVLSDSVGETFNLYRKRFTLHNNAAAKRGMYLKRMRLKSDVRYSNFADKCGAYPMDSDEYEELTPSVKNNLFITTFDVKALENAKTVTKIDTSKCQVRVFEMNDYSYEDAMRWYPIMSGRFEPKDIVYIFNGYLMIIKHTGEARRVPMASVDKEIGRELADEGILYQMSAVRFYIPAVNGDFVLEVK